MCPTRSRSRLWLLQSVSDSGQAPVRTCMPSTGLPDWAPREPSPALAVPSPLPAKHRPELDRVRRPTLTRTALTGRLEPQGRVRYELLPLGIPCTRCGARPPPRVPNCLMSSRARSVVYQLTATLTSVLSVNAPYFRSSPGSTVPSGPGSELQGRHALLRRWFPSTPGVLRAASSLNGSAVEARRGAGLRR